MIVVCKVVAPRVALRVTCSEVLTGTVWNATFAAVAPPLTVSEDGTVTSPEELLSVTVKPVCEVAMFK